MAVATKLVSSIQCMILLSNCQLVPIPPSADELWGLIMNRKELEHDATQCQCEVEQSLDDQYIFEHYWQRDK